VPDTPVAAARALVHQVGELAASGKRIRIAPEAYQSSTGGGDTEKLLYLGLVEAIEQRLVRTIEAARDAIKVMKSAGAHEWLRRRLRELGE
jgi:hypothetical protein